MFVKIFGLITRLRKITLFSVTGIFLLLSHNSHAQIIDSIYYSWKVFEFEEEIDKGFEPVKRCYIMSKPENSQSNYTAPRNAYLAVTRYENTRSEEVSVSAGFEYKINGIVYVLIDDKEFKFFTKHDSAWLDHSSKDKIFIEKMLNSSTTKARADSAIGSYAIDDYSLKGFARAYRRMRELCP